MPATTRLGLPAAHSNTIRARCASACAHSWAVAPNSPGSRALQPPDSKVLSVSRPHPRPSSIWQTRADCNIFNALKTQGTSNPLTKRKGTGNFEQWQNVGKYYLRVSAPKTQCPGATSAPCTCELQRKPLPSRKRNRRSEAAAISVTLADQNPYLIRWRRSADDVVTVRRDRRRRSLGSDRRRLPHGEWR